MITYINCRILSLRIFKGFILPMHLLFRQFLFVSMLSAVSQVHAELGSLDCIVEPSDIVETGVAQAGIISAVNFDRSDVVAEGAIIATLESGVEHASVKRAELNAKSTASIELQRRTHNLTQMLQSRNRPLAAVSAISKQDMEQIDTEASIAALRVEQEEHNFAVAKIEYERAKATLERTVVKSPIEGVVMQRYKTVGEFVDDEPILKIAKLHPLHIETLVPTEFMGTLRPGLLAKIHLAFDEEKSYTAMVERIDRVADAASDTFGVRLRLENPDYEIPAGVRCSVKFDPLPALEEEVAALSKKDRFEIPSKLLSETESKWVFRPIHSILDKFRALSSAQIKKAELDTRVGVIQRIRPLEKDSNNEGRGAQTPPSLVDRR